MVHHSSKTLQVFLEHQQNSDCGALDQISEEFYWLFSCFSTWCVRLLRLILGRLILEPHKSMKNYEIHPSCKSENLDFYLEIDGKTAASCPTFPWLGFNQLPTEHSRIRGYRIIGYEHNLPSNGGYPLSLNPNKVPATLYQARTACPPFINVSPS